jgi:hypothetical protein
MGDGRIFLITRSDGSFKKGQSNEPTFGLIHIAGQYFKQPLGLELKLANSANIGKKKFTKI